MTIKTFLIDENRISILGRTLAIQRQWRLVFFSLPKTLSKEIRDNMGWQEEGWGRMKTSAKIADLSWDTAIWFDSKSKAYLLPVKADIRKKTGFKKGDVIDVIIAL